MSTKLFVDSGDISEALDISPFTFQHFMQVSGGIDAPVASIRSRRSIYPTRGYRLPETIKFLRMRVPSFDGDAEARLIDLAREEVVVKRRNAPERGAA